MTKSIGIRLSPMGIAVVTSALLLTACGGAEEDEPTAEADDQTSEAPADLDALHEAAQEEGEVTAWIPTGSPELTEALKKGFADAFPGVELTLFEAGQSSEALPRLLAEAQSGQSTADTWTTTTGSIQPLVEQDLIQFHDDWDEMFGLAEQEIYVDGGMVQFYNLLPVLGYNEERVSEDELPETWQDLLDPRWKGRILLESKGNAFVGMLAEYSDDEILSFVEDFLANEPTFTNGGTATYQQLASGQGDMAIGAYLHNYLNGGDEDGVNYHLISPQRVQSNGTAVLASAPHPNAGKLFAGWMASVDGQEALATVTSRTGIGEGSPQGEALSNSGVTIFADGPENQDQALEMEEAIGGILSGR